MALDEEKKILIVDDSPGHISYLGGILEADYDIVVTNNGLEAITLSEQEEPDLILLDVLMPEMNGYEVCERLMANEKTRDIPVIFVTTKGDVQDEAKGFLMGAVDYVTKPISPPIVRARVKTHLSLRAAYRELKDRYAEMSEAEALRMKVESFLSHDLKSPLNGIFGYANFLLENDPSPAQVKKYSQFIKDRTTWLVQMIKESSNLIKMEQKAYQPDLKDFDMLPVIRGIISDNHNLIQKKEITPEIWIGERCASEGEPFFVLGEESLCYSIFSNLIKNALDASPVACTMAVLLKENEERAIITVKNSGTVPLEIRDTFFQKYVTHGKRGGTGLGTYSAKWMVETQQGVISMQTSEEEGTSLIVELLKGKSHENFDYG